MLGLLAGLGFGLFAGSAHVQRFDGWRLEVRRDAFAQSVVCRLSRPHATVQGARLIWRLGSRLDTSTALYRIDDGPPQAAPFFALPASANLANPSDGRISLELSALSGARRISAEVLTGGHVYDLRVRGLDKALSAAQEAQCGPFIPPSE